MIYNFRVDRTNRPRILKRLRETQRLSQGWGGGIDNDLQITNENFVADCREAYGLNSTRIPTNLTRMLAFKDGDLIVTPHLPEDGKVSLHQVDGDFPSCYHYCARDSSHLNHQIKVRKSVGLGGQISIYNEKITNWYAKLPWIRLPLIQISELGEPFMAIFEALHSHPEQTFERSTLNDFFESELSKVVDAFKSALGKVSPSLSDISFEAVCRSILEKEGFEILRAHSFDRRGGDVDFICTGHERSGSPFEISNTTLYVQVKKHEGETGVDAVRQLLQMLEKEPSADGCVISLADFTDEATSLADKKGIALVNGNMVCRLLLRHLLS